MIYAPTAWNSSLKLAFHLKSYRNHRVQKSWCTGYNSALRRVVGWSQAIARFALTTHQLHEPSGECVCESRVDQRLPRNRALWSLQAMGYNLSALRNKKPVAIKIACITRDTRTYGALYNNYDHTLYMTVHLLCTNSASYRKLENSKP